MLALDYGEMPATLEHAGSVALWPTPTDTPAPVRVGLVDTSPHAHPSDEPWKLFGRSRHGFGLANLLRTLACDQTQQCVATLSSSLAATYYYDGDGTLQEDRNEGGHFGSLASLAEAITHAAGNPRGE